MAPTAQRQTFGQRLRADLEACDVSIRELGKRLYPDSPGSGRRVVQKLLADSHVPRRSTRNRVAIALGFEPGRYDDPDDEEEALRFLFDKEPIGCLVDALVARLHREILLRELEDVAV